MEYSSKHYHRWFMDEKLEPSKELEPLSSTPRLRLATPTHQGLHMALCEHSKKESKNRLNAKIHIVVTGRFQGCDWSAG